MANTNPYDRFLAHQRKRISESPERQVARRAAFATAPRKDEFGSLLRRENIPIGVASQVELDKQRISSETTTGLVERAGMREIERKRAAGDRIAELEFKSDMWEEQEQKRKDQREDQKIDTAWQIGGAVAGGIIGSVVPGAVTMVGAQIGAGLGQVIGGFTGEDYADYNQAIDGFGSMIQGFTDISTTASNKKMGQQGKEMFSYYSGLGSDEMEKFILQYRNAIGNNDLMEALYNNMPKE